MITEPVPNTLFPIRWCTGKCSHADHKPHIYLIDPVDGEMDRPKLCPGNVGRVVELLEDGEPTNLGFIAMEGFSV